MRPRAAVRRPLAGVLAAMAISLTGTRVSAIALPWYVLATTGSAARTGLAAFCELAPYVVTKALAGPVVDRAGPRRISWSADLVSAGAAAAVPLCHVSTGLPFGVLLALVAIVGGARGPGDLAKEVMVPDAAERSGVPLPRAMGLSGAVERLASTAGPAAGGALVAAVGPVAGVAVNAACFAAASAVVAVAAPGGADSASAVPGVAAPSASGPDAAGPDGAASGARGEPARYGESFAEGLRFLRGDRFLTVIVVMVIVTNLLDAAFMSVLVPVWARESGHGAAVVGVTAAVWGAAALCGSLTAAAFAHRLPRRAVFTAGFLVAGAPRFLVLAADAPLAAVLVTFAAGGLGGGFLNPVLGATMVERVPRGMLGRVNALGDALAWAGVPLGGLAAGAALGLLPLAPVLAAGGLGYLVVTMVPVVRREWRELDARAVEAPSGG